MNPEWMIAFDRQTTAMQRSQRNAFADPLERAEWRGLQWVNTLFSRWLERGRPQPLQMRRCGWNCGYARPI